MIGNSDYQDEKKLANSKNDAKLLSKVFKEDLKFDDVQILEDAIIQQLGRKVDDFKQLLNGADVSLIYFSGHGQQSDDQQNYLLAVDAQIKQSADIKHFAVNSNDLLASTLGAKLNW